MHDANTDTRKTAIFIMRLSPEEKAVMEKAARAKGVSLAGFLRSNGMAAAGSENTRVAA